MHQKRSEMASEDVLEPQNRSESMKMCISLSAILQIRTQNPGFETSD